MSDTIGSVIESEYGSGAGKPDVNADVRSTNTDTERIIGSEKRVEESERINGYETAEPRTERVDNRNSDGIRLTKSGQPDRRGRPRGKSNTGETEKSTLGVALNNISVAGLLLGIHSMAARILDEPIWKIEKTEAEELSTAIQGVAKEYGHVVNPKTAAWIQLGVTCGAVYGTRIAAISMTKPKSVIKSPTNGAPSPVYEMPNPVVPRGDLN